MGGEVEAARYERETARADSQGFLKARSADSSMKVLELVRGAGTPGGGEFRSNGGFEESPDTFHLTFDPELEPAAQAVVKAASFVHNVDPVDLEPLADAVDPDALEALVGCQSRRPGSGVEITFTYVDLTVTVSDSGDVWLRWS